MARNTRRGIELPVSPTEVFELLHTPSAIRHWWGAARAIVLAQPGGIWTATWESPRIGPTTYRWPSMKPLPPCRLTVVT